jgi:hypothetical protein
MMAAGRRILVNEDGFILGASILISAILLLAGVLALWTSSTEMHVVRNESDLTIEFYNAEGGAVDALENFGSGPTRWLTDAFLLAGPAEAGSVVTSADTHGQAVATVEVRCIEDTGATIEELSPEANALPRQRHITAPPAGSGYSLKYFEVRRYGLTARSATGNTRVQIGAYKVFNKY